MNQYSTGYREKYAMRRKLLWTIRADYLRGLREREEILEASAAPPDGQPRGTQIGNPTERKAVQLTERGKFCGLVDKALKSVPDYYREDIKKAAIYGRPYPSHANVKTYERHMRAFLDSLKVLMEVHDGEACEEPDAAAPGR